MDITYISEHDTQYFPNLADYNLDMEINRDAGIKQRIISTFNKHWPNSLPFVHFTNSRVSWGVRAPITPTGFVNSFFTEGIRPYTNVGYVPTESMSEEIRRAIHLLDVLSEDLKHQEYDLQEQEIENGS